MKNKYPYFILTVIAICLLYIGFLKPTPQRYVLKEEQKEDKQNLLHTFTHTTSVFDTATGKIYMLFTTTHSNLQDGTQTTRRSYIISDLINGEIIHKDPEKDIKIIGYKEKKFKIPSAEENE